MEKTPEQIAYDEAVSRYVEAYVQEQKRTALIIAQMVGANEGETSIIERYAELTRHGCKFSDLHIRRDGQEYHFEADWLYRLFRMTPSELMLAMLKATRPEMPSCGGTRQ